MKYVALLTCLAGALLLGCQKREATSNSPPRYVSDNADNAVRQNVNGEVNDALTTQLRSFVKKRGSMPQSFAEYASALDYVPKAPEGKKWVIDSASQEVKAVDK
jgi:hypothetical protein